MNLPVETSCYDPDIVKLPVTLLKLPIMIVLLPVTIPSAIVNPIVYALLLAVLGVVIYRFLL